MTNQIYSNSKYKAWLVLAIRMTFCRGFTRLLVLALCVDLFGCAATLQLKQQSADMESWMGRDMADLIQSWGKPTTVSDDGKGGKVLDFIGNETHRLEMPNYVAINGEYVPGEDTTYNVSYRYEFNADSQGNITSWKWSSDKPDRDDFEDFISRVKAESAKGNASAARWLGYWYAAGTNGLPQDIGLAMHWDQVAADQGLVDAENNLGACYYSDDKFRDYTKAFYWFKKSADQGYSCGEFDLAKCYEEGNGVRKDLGLAKSWYQKAADQGDEGAKEALSKLSR